MAMNPFRVTSWYVMFFFRLFRDAPFGTLRVTTPRGRVHVFKGANPGIDADMKINDWKIVRIALIRGDIGFGEGYIDGLWDTTDLPRLMTYMVENMQSIGAVCHGNLLMRMVFGFINWMRKNSKSGSRKNISAHYDVGNDFYRLWLDKTMTYSSALFGGDAAMSLEDAQRAKYQRLLNQVENADAQILEIGCGWGGFAEQAARADYNVTGLTLSSEQLKFAQARLTDAKLDGKVDLKLQDYRDEKGVFDYIVSIEMFEAVGEKYWPVYFKTIKDRLKTHGKALIQTITIDHTYFDDYRKRSDFIRHYTFPGGLLPSIERIKEEIEVAGLKCREVFAFGKDYAHTLQLWLDRMDARGEEIKALGYSEDFLRSWRFYMGCCIGAFAAGRTDVVQLEIVHA